MHKTHYITTCMKDDLQQLIDDFSLFDDWEDRYAYLIDLGKKIDGLPENLKTEDRLVKGCTSKVWLVLDWQGIGNDKLLQIKADSDAVIVRGLVALVLKIYNGCTPDEVLDVDMQNGFEQMGLDAHLSPSRRNGFFSMIEIIRNSASAVI